MLNETNTVASISCLMPVFNGERYLSEAIESILAQTKSDLEFIIIDDGSTDATPQIISHYAARDQRIVPLRQENAGIVSALNTGLKHASGQFIARMDADDIALEDRFQFQCQYLSDHPECVLVGGYAETFGDDGHKSTITTGGWRTRTNLETFPPAIAVAVHPLVMIRTKTLREIGGYREGFPYAEDYDLYIRLSEHGEIHNPPKLVLKYRAHEGAVSTQKLETQEWAALASEFDALHLKIPEPPPEADITAQSKACAQQNSTIGNGVVHTYFWFRVWRRRRNTPLERQAFYKMLPFLLGFDTAAWGTRYGLPLRGRILASMIFHSPVANMLRGIFRRNRAASHQTG